jgi:hypothetical protein
VKCGFIIAGLALAVPGLAQGVSLKYKFSKGVPHRALVTMSVQYEIAVEAKPTQRFRALNHSSLIDTVRKVDDDGTITLAEKSRSIDSLKNGSIVNTGGPWIAGTLMLLRSGQAILSKNDKPRKGPEENNAYVANLMQYCLLPDDAVVVGGSWTNSINFATTDRSADFISTLEKIVQSGSSKLAYIRVKSDIDPNCLSATLGIGNGGPEVNGVAHYRALFIFNITKGWVKSCRAELSFDNVTMSVPSREDPENLQQVSLQGTAKFESTES